MCGDGRHSQISLMMTKSIRWPKCNCTKIRRTSDVICQKQSIKKLCTKMSSPESDQWVPPLQDHTHRRQGLTITGVHKILRWTAPHGKTDIQKIPNKNKLAPFLSTFGIPNPPLGFPRPLVPNRFVLSLNRLDHVNPNNFPLNLFFSYFGLQ